MSRVLELVRKQQISKRNVSDEEFASMSPAEIKLFNDMLLCTATECSEGLQECNQRVQLIDRGGIDLNNEELRQSHLAGLHSISTYDRHHVSICSPGIDERAAKHVCTLEPKNLTPVGIQHLSKNMINSGKILWVTTVEPCYKISGIQLLVQDEFGRLALLGLYNFMQANGTNFDAQVLFPVGTLLGIKEPYYKLLNSGCFGLRADNPCNVIIERFKNYATMDTTALKEVGNKFFAEKNCARAEELYSYALCNESGGVSQLPLYLNRAAARLGLNDYVGALADSEAAMVLDKNNIKAQYRKAQALFGLMRYAEAVDIYADLISKEAKERIFIEQHAKAISAIKQSAGFYDLLSFPFDPNMQNETDVAEYFGPIRVQYAKEQKKGRGLFLTEDVKAGQILFVERSLVYCIQNPSTAIFAISADKSINEGSLHGVVNDLVLLASQSMKANSLLSILTKGEKGVRLPLLNLDALRPGKAGLPVVQPVSAEDVRRIVKFNAFGFKVCSDPTIETRKRIIRTMSMPVPLDVERAKRSVMIQPVTKLMEILCSPSPNPRGISAAVRKAGTAEINVVDPNGLTALHLAVIQGSTSTVDMLLEAGAEVNAADVLGLTPLHMAAGEFFQLHIMQALIRRGANVNAQSTRGLVPLTASVMLDRVDAAKFLLKHGADPTIEDYIQGASPLDHIAEGSTRIQQVFAEAGHNPLAEASGVWPVASLMNHANPENTRRRFVGRMMFVTAARDLKAGVETSYSHQTEKLRHWNIDH